MNDILNIETPTDIPSFKSTGVETLPSIFDDVPEDELEDIKTALDVEDRKALEDSTHPDHGFVKTAVNFARTIAEKAAVSPAGDVVGNVLNAASGAGEAVTFGLSEEVGALLNSLFTGKDYDEAYSLIKESNEEFHTAKTTGYVAGTVTQLAGVAKTGISFFAKKLLGKGKIDKVGKVALSAMNTAVGQEAIAAGTTITKIIDKATKIPGVSSTASRISSATNTAFSPIQGSGMLNSAVNAGKNVILGGAVGGLEGFGISEGDLGQRLKGATQGAIFGAGMGAGLEAIGTGVSLAKSVGGEVPIPGSKLGTQVAVDANLSSTDLQRGAVKIRQGNLATDAGNPRLTAAGEEVARLNVSSSANEATKVARQGSQTDELIELGNSALGTENSGKLKLASEDVVEAQSKALASKDYDPLREIPLSREAELAALRPAGQGEDIQIINQAVRDSGIAKDSIVNDIVDRVGLKPTSWDEIGNKTVKSIDQRVFDTGNLDRRTRAQVSKIAETTPETVNDYLFGLYALKNKKVIKPGVNGKIDPRDLSEDQLIEFVDFTSRVASKSDELIAGAILGQVNSDLARVRNLKGKGAVGKMAKDRLKQPQKDLEQSTKVLKNEGQKRNKLQNNEVDIAKRISDQRTVQNYHDLNEVEKQLRNPRFVTNPSNLQQKVVNKGRTLAKELLDRVEAVGDKTAVAQIRKSIKNFGERAELAEAYKEIFTQIESKTGSRIKLKAKARKTLSDNFGKDLVDQFFKDFNKYDLGRGATNRLLNKQSRTTSREAQDKFGETGSGIREGARKYINDFLNTFKNARINKTEQKALSEAFFSGNQKESLKVFDAIIENVKSSERKKAMIAEYTKISALAKDAQELYADD